MKRETIWTLPIASLLARPKAEAALARLRRVKQVKAKAKLETKGLIR